MKRHEWIIIVCIVGIVIVALGAIFVGVAGAEPIDVRRPLPSPIGETATPAATIVRPSPTSPFVGETATPAATIIRPTATPAGALPLIPVCPGRKGCAGKGALQ